MRKAMIKLILVAFVLMYSHQAFEHIAHVHGGESALSSKHAHCYQDLLFENSHSHHFENDYSVPAGHDRDMHQHFSEIHPKKIKQSRKLLSGSLAVNCIRNVFFVPIGGCSKQILAEGFGKNPNSLIPQYLRAQSFLI